MKISRSAIEKLLTENINKKFNHLTILGRCEEKHSDNKTRVIVMCDCLNQTKYDALLSDVIYNRVKSCGCTKGPKIKNVNRIGRYKEPERHIWHLMKYRCENDSSYINITISNRWLDYETFIHDMGYRPTPKHQIDRIDPREMYCKSNCRWVTSLQNIANREFSNKSGYMGVYESGNRWRVVVDNKQFGCFDDKKDAARIYDNIVISQHGYEYAMTNIRLGKIPAISGIEQKHLKFFNDVHWRIANEKNNVQCTLNKIILKSNIY